MPRQNARHSASTVGSNLRAARVARDWTQRRVADAVGVTPAEVSRWERGGVEPGHQYRYLLADLFFEGDVSALYAPLDPSEAVA